MEIENDYIDEIGQLSEEENREYLACCEVILANLKRQSRRDERVKEHLVNVRKIAFYHQRVV